MGRGLRGGGGGGVTRYGCKGGLGDAFVKGKVADSFGKCGGMGGGKGQSRLWCKVVMDASRQRVEGVVRV